MLGKARTKKSSDHDAFGRVEINYAEVMAFLQGSEGRPPHFRGKIKRKIGNLENTPKNLSSTRGSASQNSQSLPPVLKSVAYAGGLGGGVQPPPEPENFFVEK